jgi:hypothetical protein
VTSADVRLSVGVEMFRIESQLKEISGIAAFAVTESLADVTDWN